LGSLMIRVYTASGKTLQSGDIVSLKTLNNFSSRVDWLWVDCWNLDEKETKIILNFLQVEEKVFNNIQRKIHPTCERYRDYVLISIPYVEFVETLRVHPISLIMKEKSLITARDEHSAKLVGKIVETLGSYMLENGDVNLSFVVSRLFREIAEENSKAMMFIKEKIDRVEERALENPRDKSVTHSVFKLKKEIFTLHRLLWVEKELMSDMKECVIPYLKINDETRLIIEDAINDIDRELEFEDSYSRTLDDILRLQDLGLIHKVERTLIYLTAIIILLTIISIILTLFLK
jgi:Mg2+ and Co2+ transporter CorA